MVSKNKEAMTVWEYVDWLYCSNRLTAEEHGRLKEYLITMDAELQLVLDNEGC